MRPITPELHRFAKISATKPPVGFRRNCYGNAIRNFEAKGWKIVGGFAIEDSYAQNLLKTGSTGVHPGFRGYEHAWNIDASGAIIDSTYRDGAPKYRYYGKVVPVATAKSFKDDEDLLQWVRKLTGEHNARHKYDKDYEASVFKSQQNLTQLGNPMPSVITKQLKDKGFIFHSVESNRKWPERKGFNDVDVPSTNSISLLFLNPKTSTKLYVNFNDTEKKVNLIRTIKTGEMGEGPLNTWHNLESWLNGERPINKR